MHFTKLASIVLAAAALCSVAGPAAADDAKSLEVKRLVFARGIDGHEPQDAVPLKVSGKAKHFRTWAFTRRAHEAGEWSVVVRAPGGKALARQSFTITK